MDSIITLIILSLYALPTYCLQCKFNLGSSSYDICPLIFATAGISSTGRLIHVHQQGGAASWADRTIYDMDLAGDGLYYNLSLPDDSQQCPKGTWICMKVLSESPSDGSKVTQAVPLAGNIQYEDFRGEVDAEARLIIPDVEFGIPPLEIILKGGYYSSQPQQVRFLFTCNPDAQEPTLPMLKPTDSTITTTMAQGAETAAYTHTFTWSSRHACPINQDAISASSHTPAPAPFSSWKALFNDEAPQEESNNLRPNKGKTAGIVIGSIAGACVLLGGVYYLHSRRSKAAYDTHGSICELVIQWASAPVHYAQQIPLSSLRVPFSSVISFVKAKNPFSRSGRSRRQYRYSPLFAEEYEIQDRDLIVDELDEEEAIVDLQGQQRAASRIKASRGNMGYGSI